MILGSTGVATMTEVRLLASFMPVATMAEPMSTTRFAWPSRRSLKTRFRAETCLRFAHINFFPRKVL